MHVVLGIKESELPSVLEVLGKARDTVNIVVNIKEWESKTKEQESEKKIPGLVSSTGEWIAKQKKRSKAEKKKSQPTR